jgi:hypothetical protein
MASKSRSNVPNIIRKDRKQQQFIRGRSEMADRPKTKTTGAKGFFLCSKGKKEKIFKLA